MNTLLNLKHSLRLVGLAVALAMATAAAPVCAQNKIVMKLGHTLSPDNHYQLAALAFAKVIKDKTQGQIDIQVFPQSQLGGEVQMTQALRTGTQDLMISGQAAMVNTIKQWEVFDIPYMFSSIDDANHVMQGAAGQKFLDMMASYNLVGLSWISSLERNVFTGKKAINSLADMKDLKVRVMQSPGYISGYKALGANPTPLPYNQVFLAVSQGLVDGADVSPEQFTQDKFSDVAKYYYFTRVTYMPIVLAMSKSGWNKLNPQQQQIFREAAREAARVDIVEYKKQYDEAIAQMKKQGIHVSEIDTKPWAAATEKVRAELIAKVPDGAASFKLINDARAAK